MSASTVMTERDIKRFGITAPPAIGEHVHIGEHFMLRTPSSGGKAGRGRNRTSNVQLLFHIGRRWIMVKQFRFVADDSVSWGHAFFKARDLAIELNGQLEAERTIVIHGFRYTFRTMTHPCE